MAIYYIIYIYCILYIYIFVSVYFFGLIYCFFVGKRFMRYKHRIWNNILKYEQKNPFLCIY